MANRIYSYDPDEDPLLQSLITFDNGGEWTPLVAPLYQNCVYSCRLHLSIDSNGESYSCLQCTLNLHGIHKNTDGIAESDIWGPVYTPGTAVGLILATGNVGLYLSDQLSDVATFFSRDGGISWKEVAKGSFVYEFGDHGAITVMANSIVSLCSYLLSLDIDQTDSIIYSWNEGINWTECAFGSSMLVNDILVQPGGTSQMFLAYGTKTAGSFG